MRYVVAYGQTDRNYSAFVPDLPIVIVTGKTLADLEREARSAIAFHLKGTPRAGEPFEVDLVPLDDYHGPVRTLDGALIPADDLLADDVRATAADPRPTG